MLKKVIYASLIIIWCIVIFNFSSMNAADSGNKSKEVIKTVTTYTCAVGYKMGLLEKMPAEDSIEWFATNMNTPFRKASHAFVYFVLATILMFAIRKNTKIPIWGAVLISFVVCFVYSLTDEFHQTFVTGRGGDIRDCLIDSAGALLAILIYVVIRWIHRSFNKSERK